MPHSFAVKCSTPVTHSSVKNNLGHKKIHVCVYIYINYIYIYNYYYFLVQCLARGGQVSFSIQTVH